MASSTCSPTLSISATLIDAKPHLRHSALSSTQSLTRRPLNLTATAHCSKIARNVATMATGEAPAASDTDLPEFVKTAQQAWDKIDDKYAVSSLVVAVAVALWASTGVISAIDRLPVVPGVLELVGIGYTGWFTYKNLAFEPDREALLSKIKETYEDITGSN